MVLRCKTLYVLRNNWFCDAKHCISLGIICFVMQNLFLIMTIIFLISPVQNPWYLSWLVPFLCFFHSRALILLTGLIGLYYLDFYFDYQEMTQYSFWIVWSEYIPFYIYLIWELTRSKNNCTIQK